MREFTSAFPTDPVALSVVADTDACVVILCGELDIACGEAVDAGLATVPAGCSRVVLDLGGVSFIDCSGLQVLETALDRLGCDVVVREASRPVRWMLELLGPATLGSWVSVVANEARSA